MLLLLIHMQGLQDDLSESQSPPDVQSEHSTLDSDTVQHTSGPVCLFCKEHLLKPSARICAGCGHLHRASKLTQENITANEHNVQETNPPSGRMDTQDKQFKYPSVFGTHSSPQLISLPAGTQIQTTSQCSSRNQEASKAGLNVTVKDFLTRFEREKNVRVSVPATARPTLNISTEIATAVNDMLIKNPRKRKSSSNEQFFIKHFRPDDTSDCTEIDPDEPNKMSGAAVSDAKNKSSTSPETEARVDSHTSSVGCLCIMCP